VLFDGVGTALAFELQLSAMSPPRTANSREKIKPGGIHLARRPDSIPDRRFTCIRIRGGGQPFQAPKLCGVIRRGAIGCPRNPNTGNHKERQNVCWFGIQIDDGWRRCDIRV
jgi:hypothetical protein